MAYESGILGRALDEFLPQVQLPPPPPADVASLAPSDGPWTVILTGSTGSLGTYILAVLARLPPERLRRVYCLNRSEPCPVKHRSALQDERFVFLRAAFDAPLLGLPQELYQQLLDEVTVVLHNAWTVNFLLPGEAFRPSLAGLRNFLHFSYRSPAHPPLLFVSSLGIGYAAELAHVDEVVYDDPLVADAIADGYSQSKYAAERLIDAYARSTGLPAAVLRVGQIAGPVSLSPGMWPAREWLPTLLRASRYLGALPRSLGLHDAVDWIPVDAVAEIAVEVAEYFVGLGPPGPPPVGGGGARAPPGRAAFGPGAAVFNVANPATVPFGDLVPHLFDFGVANRTVSGDEWLRLLGQSAAANEAAGKRTPPGAKLLLFYQRILEGNKPPIETATHNLEVASATARNLQPVNQRWLRRWLGEWGYRAMEVRAHL